MKKQKKDTKWLVQLALMAAIIVVLANTPLGMIDPKKNPLCPSFKR